MKTVESGPASPIGASHHSAARGTGLRRAAMILTTTVTPATAIAIIAMFSHHADVLTPNRFMNQPTYSEPAIPPVTATTATSSAAVVSCRHELPPPGSRSRPAMARIVPVTYRSSVRAPIGGMSVNGMVTMSTVWLTDATRTAPIATDRRAQNVRKSWFVRCEATRKEATAIATPATAGPHTSSFGKPVRVPSRISSTSATAMTTAIGVNQPRQRATSRLPRHGLSVACREIGTGGCQLRVFGLWRVPHAFTAAACPVSISADGARGRAASRDVPVRRVRRVRQGRPATGCRRSAGR